MKLGTYRRCLLKCWTIVCQKVVIMTMPVDLIYISTLNSIFGDIIDWENFSVIDFIIKTKTQTQFVLIFLLFLISYGYFSFLFFGHRIFMSKIIFWFFCFLLRVPKLFSKMKNKRYKCYLYRYIYTRTHSCKHELSTSKTKSEIY